jgi:succinyl-diaminopimelate desuccinylase
VTDLLALTAELVDIASPSFDERAIADVVEQRLRAAPALRVDRIGDNVVARTDLGRDQRLLLVGHTDTVPADDNERAVVEGDVLHGLGSADMKGGLAVFLALADEVAAGTLDPAVDLTWVFYAAEEVAAVHNGLGVLARDAPELLAGDAAVLGEPTDGWLEAGCQGTIRLTATLHGARAHTARPWTGRNAVHRLGRLLALVEAFPERRPVLDGCEFREALQAVAVDGGVAGNVVPDRATVTLNHRFAPDRSAAEAEAAVRTLLAPALEDGDEVALVDAAAAARPGLDHPLLAALRDRGGLPVRAKLGWTDVARLVALGIPAVNLGPGDPLLAHTRHERVSRDQLERTHTAVRDLVAGGA